MQRTIKGTEVHYVEIVGYEDGKIVTDIKVAKVAEADPTKALKKFTKTYGTKTVLKCEPFEQTYYLDDEIFFKHATTEKGGE